MIKENNLYLVFYYTTFFSNSEDVKAVNIHLQQLLSQLVTTYVTIAKTVNKELINLIGTDLGVFEISSNDFSDPSNSYARSEILSSLMRIDTEGIKKNGFHYMLIIKFISLINLLLVH